MRDKCVQRAAAALQNGRRSAAPQPRRRQVQAQPFCSTTVAAAEDAGQHCAGRKRGRQHRGVAAGVIAMGSITGDGSPGGWSRLKAARWIGRQRGGRCRGVAVGGFVTEGSAAARRQVVSRQRAAWRVAAQRFRRTPHLSTRAVVLGRTSPPRSLLKISVFNSKGILRAPRFSIRAQVDTLRFCSR